MRPQKHRSTTQGISSTTKNTIYDEHLQIKKIHTFLYNGQEKANILKMGIVQRGKHVMSLENVLNKCNLKAIVLIIY